MKTKFFCLFAIASLTPACGGLSDADFRNAVPDADSVTINTPGNTTALAVGEESGYYRVTRQISRDVNGGVRAVIGLIKSIVRNPPSSKDGDRRIWGPGADDALSPVLYRFVAEKEGEGKFSYRLEYRPKDSPDEDASYTAIIKGESDVSSGQNDGIGGLTLFIDNWVAVEPGACGSGTLDIAYDTTAEPKQVTVDFSHFGETCGGVDGKQALDAATYYYARYADGSGNFQFAATGDVDNGAVQPAVLETLAIRSRWNKSGAGRSDVRIFGGDLTANHGIEAVTASECWDDLFGLTYADIDPPAVDYGHNDIGAEGDCPSEFQSAEYASDLSL